MPVERHIFLAQLTGIADEREVERVLVRTCEPVNAFALAALRVYSARPHDCYRVAREGHVPHTSHPVCHLYQNRHQRCRRP